MGDTDYKKPDKSRYTIDMTPRNILAVLALFVFISLMYGALRFFYFARLSSEVIDNSQAYQQDPENADIKILIMGDSTALGTGAKDPANSVAGRLGKDFPDAEIVNRAQNGMKTGELLENLEQFLQESKYDLVVIHIGANDVLRLKDLEQTQENILEIINDSLQKSEYVALFTSGDIGDAKLIPWFARSLMSQRSHQLRDFGVALQEEVDGMIYVDLYHQDAGIADEQFYARDMLHLSDEGYGFWHQELRRALEKETDLY